MDVKEGESQRDPRLLIQITEARSDIKRFGEVRQRIGLDMN